MYFVLLSFPLANVYLEAAFLTVLDRMMSVTFQI